MWLPGRVASHANPNSCGCRSSSSSSLLPLATLARRDATGLVRLEWPCPSDSSRHSHSLWIDAASVATAELVADANAALGRGIHEPPFEREHGHRLALWSSPKLGRFVVAATDIDLGSQVMSATAFAVVVSDRCTATRCHWCFKQLTKKAFRCGACAFAMYCSRKCLDDDAVLHDPQCTVLAALVHTPSTPLMDKELLRLTLAVIAMEAFLGHTQALARLHVPHPASGGGQPDPRTQAHDAAARLLRRHVKVSPLRSATRSHIRTILEKLQSNVHPLVLSGSAGVCGLGIFPEAAMTVNHSCQPNVVPSFDPATRSLRFFAVQSVHAMHVIEYSYLADLCVSSSRRRELLRDGFGFECQCYRCTQPQPEPTTQEDDLVQSLVAASSIPDPLSVLGHLAKLEHAHRLLLEQRRDLEYSLRMVQLRAATQCKDSQRTITVASRLLVVWELQGLPLHHPTTETLHQQIVVAAARLGDSVRTNQSRDRVQQIQRVCGFQAEA